MTPTKQHPEKFSTTVWLTPEAWRTLGVEAALCGRRRNAVIASAIYTYLGVAEPEAAERREARAQIAALADLVGEFSVEEARAETGLKRAACAHHLRELVRTGVLTERVLPNASGGEKRYRAAGTGP